MHNTNFEPQDICEWNKDIEVDLIMHGSPCQDFSLAGKQAGGDKDSGTRSSLMYETIRIVEKLKPKYVIWENVKNLLSKKHRHNFDAYLETMEQLGYKNYYQVLNAKDYGIPQNRERVFTISILGNQNYEFSEGNKCNNEIKVVGNYMPSGHDASRIVDEYGLAPTVKENHGTVTAVLQRFEFPPKQELKLKLKDMLEDNVDEKYYLSDIQIKRIETTTYNVGKTRIQKKDWCDTLCARDWKDPKCVQVAKLPYFNYESDGRVYSVSGLHPCLRSKEPNQKIDENDGILNKTDYKIRKLTPKECWRLMGFDDEDFEKASKVNSNTQCYKQAGNSIVVNVLEAILRELLKNE